MSLSPWGYLFFTAWATLMAVLARGWWLAGLAAVEIGFGLIWNRKGLHPLSRPRFWMLVLGAVVLTPFLIGEPDVLLGPLHLSRQGLGVGLEMAGRALTLTLAFSVGMASLGLSDVVLVCDRLGLRGLGFATAIAINLLETLQDMVLVTLQTIKLRGGLRRPWRALRLFLITVVANTLTYGDDLVRTASVRAFDPNRRSPLPLPLRRADLVLMIVLLLCSLILL